MKWHGHGLGSQDSKMERETFLEMYLHRPHAKKNNPKPQKTTLVQGPLEGAGWKKGWGDRDEDPRSSTRPEARHPKGTAGALFAAPAWHERVIFSPAPKEGPQKQPVVAAEVASAVGWVGSYPSSSAEQLYFPVAVGKAPEVPWKAAAASVRKNKFPRGSSYQKGLRVSLYHTSHCITVPVPRPEARVCADVGCVLRGDAPAALRWCPPGWQQQLKLPSHVPFVGRERCDLVLGCYSGGNKSEAFCRKWCICGDAWKEVFREMDQPGASDVSH